MPRFDDEPNMEQVKAILTKRDPRMKNPEVLAINAVRMMRAKNNGYPKELYHASLDPVLCDTVEQEIELQRLGYQPSYIFREFPKMMYRRNFGDRYSKTEFVEEKVVKSREEEAALKGIKEAPGTSHWKHAIADLPPLPDQMEQEDLNAQIERLRGALEEAQRVADKKSKQPAA
jgi:hypothetical protein